jgi:predicted RNase H-like HicB family nuclease
VTFAVEIEQEKDGRWIAEIPQIPGAMVYGRTREEAVSRVEALALRVLAERRWRATKPRSPSRADAAKIRWTLYGSMP